MKLKFSGMFLFLICLSPGSLLAQGIFQGFGMPKIVSATGQTEVLGSIIVSMLQGPPTAGTLVVNVSPLQITNANAADISVTPIGVTVGATTIDTTNSLVQIPVNASNNTSVSIRIDGIRVAIAGTNINSFNANLSWQNSLNAFMAGTSIPVISSVQSGLVAQPITDPFAIFNGTVYRNTSTIHVAEGYAGSFSNSALYGQTGPTQIRIRVSDFPSGLQMVFPTAVTANETGATLTTAQGVPVTLTGNNTVTYTYASAANSGLVAESFDIKFTVSIVGPLDTLQPTFEVTLAPVGGPVPNSTFPATDIPRYAEDEILLQAGSSRIITKVLYWSGSNASLQSQIHMTNPSSRVANLTIDALDSTGQDISGTGITNPVKVALPANQSLVRALSDLFGPAAGVSSIRIQSTSLNLLAAAVVSGNGTNESVPFVSQTIEGALFPVVSDSAQLQLMNPNSAAVTGTVTLRGTDGQVAGSAPVTIGPLASMTIALQTAFNTNAQTGYASAVFSSPVVAFESFGQANVLAVQPPASGSALIIPFIAGGSSFQTDVNLVNLSDQTVTLNSELFTGNGSQVGSTQSITLAPGGQFAAAVQQIFSQSPDTGYVRFDVPQLYKGFFAYYPAIAGMARIRSSQGGSTVVPLSDLPLADAFVLGDGTSAGGFEGIALVNPTASNVSATLQALNLDGSVAATATVPLSAGQVVSQLTNQLFNGGLPAQTVIRVTSSSPIAVTAISGTTALDQIRSLPVLR